MQALGAIAVLIGAWILMELLQNGLANSAKSLGTALIRFGSNVQRKRDVRKAAVDDLMVRQLEQGR